METTTRGFVERLGGRSYPFRALAHLYYPEVKPETASRYLRRLIHGDPLLLGGLRARGYLLHQHTLTPRQIGFIVGELGTPEEFRAYAQQSRRSQL